jgi:hypothetical protein
MAVGSADVRAVAVSACAGSEEQFVSSWTGRRADALRQSLRMTNESFADYLHVAVRTVAYWRQRPDTVPQQQMQVVLDLGLERASDQAKALFARLTAAAGRAPSVEAGSVRLSAKFGTAQEAGGPPADSGQAVTVLDDLIGADMADQREVARASWVPGTAPSVITGHLFSLPAWHHEGEPLAAVPSTADKWVISDQAAHPLIITKEDFELAQATLAGRGSKTQHKEHRRPRSYALRGVMLCGLCGRKMSGKWNNDQAYYLCRFPAEYALANKISHPKNVYLREAEVLGEVDDWLAELFAPDAIDATVTELTEQAERLEDPAAQARAEAARERIATYDAQISRYRASIDAGGDPAVIGPWIAETQAKKVAAQAEIRTATGRHHMNRDEIAAIVAALGEIAGVVQEADPADKADIYAKIRLTLTYQPEERLVKAVIKPGLDMHKWSVSEGGLEPPYPFGH